MKKQSKLILVSTLVLLLIGCKSAEYHKDKFFKKGGMFECIPTIIQKTDTLVLENGDTVFNTRYETVYQPKIEYKTKWQIRFDNKRFKDSLNAVKGMYKDSLKYALKSKNSFNKKEVKIHKSDNKKEIKKSRNIYLFILIYLLGLVTIPIIKLVIKKFS